MAENKIIDVHVPCLVCGKLIPIGARECLNCRISRVVPDEIDFDYEAED